MGMERNPSTRAMPHIPPDWSLLAIEKAAPPTKMIRIWPPIMRVLMPIKNQLRVRPSKMLNLLSKRRLLREKETRVSTQIYKYKKIGVQRYTYFH